LDERILPQDVQKLLIGKVKVKLSLRLIKHHFMKTSGEVEVYYHAFLTSTLDRVE
jgi:hypothetical protein